jgi:hypothetical protein
MQPSCLEGKRKNSTPRPRPHGLVRLNRSPATRAVRPEALATEFLVVLD